MQKLEFASECSWVDKLDDYESDCGEDDVLILHAGNGIPINKCNCYRCRMYKTRKKQYSLRAKIHRDLTADEFRQIEQQINEETAAAARE